jgi:hypothetical protein
MATWLHTCGHCTVGSTLDGDRAQFVHTSSSRWPAGRTPETSRCGASVAVLVSPAAVPASRKVQRECCGVLVRQLGLDGRVLTLPRDLILYMCVSVQQVESNSDKSRALIYLVFWPIIYCKFIELVWILDRRIIRSFLKLKWLISSWKTKLVCGFRIGN